MPIRINLLAEAQAAEEVRRRDPAKRAIWVGIILIAVAIGWWCSLYTKCIILRSNLSSRDAKKESLKKQFGTIEANQAKLREVSGKLAALNRFTDTRFLQANPLNALMRVSADGIQLLHLRTDQALENVSEPKPGVAEKIKLILDVKDASANPGNDEINTYKQALAASPYFKDSHISTNNIQLRNLGQAQIDTETGKPYVQFSLEIVYPDKVRQ